MSASPDQIDAAAKFLRETLQSGKKLTPWAGAPKTTKKKWLVLAEGALAAAVVTVAAPQAKRWPRKGDKMTFLDKNGYDHDREQAREAGMKDGEVFTVFSCNVGSWNHSILFEGIEGWFNGVMFELVDEPPSQ